MHAVSPAGGCPAGVFATRSILVCGVLASAALLASLSPGFAAFTGRSRSDADDVLALRQSVGTSTALGRAAQPDAVATANAYGGRLLGSGQSSTQTLTFTNAGTAAVASLTATASACSQSPAGPVAGSATDLCEKTTVRIASGGVTVFDGTAAAFGRAGAIDVLAAPGTLAVAPGKAVEVTITVAMTQASSNRYQGLQINQPITWRFGS